MKRIWITSDWHLNHEAIHNFEDRKVGYEKEIIKRINNTVKEDDVIINLGDVIFNRGRELKSYLERIRCKNIVLVRGNHDMRTTDFYYNHGFMFVCDEFKLKYQKQDVIFSHIPIETPPDGFINIHGHLHSGGHRKYITSDKHILYNPEKGGDNFIPKLLKNLIYNKLQGITKH